MNQWERGKQLSFCIPCSCNRSDLKQWSSCINNVKSKLHQWQLPSQTYLLMNPEKLVLSASDKATGDDVDVSKKARGLL
ncbi:hypothetical protein L6452_32821 [Arctium lappa]|uniref:Uncharacterized protein n=1 Tax=Arctium lappa TaxID=4217 RepID=A0ACB8ZA05_ARCLA|nr:hypothetical protein L6452_32821 [Arctium lappa]